MSKPQFDFVEEEAPSFDFVPEEAPSFDFVPEEAANAVTDSAEAVEEPRREGVWSTGVDLVRDTPITPYGEQPPQVTSADAPGVVAAGEAADEETMKAHELQSFRNQLNPLEEPRPGPVTGAIGKLTAGVTNAAAGAIDFLEDGENSPIGDVAGDPKNQRRLDVVKQRLTDLETDPGQTTASQYQELTKEARDLSRPLRESTFAGKLARTAANATAEAERVSGAAGSISRAVGTVGAFGPALALGPGGLAGLAVAGGQASAEASSATRTAVADDLRKQGFTDETQIDIAAQAAGNIAAAKAALTLPIYLLTGRLAAAGAGKVLPKVIPNATRLQKVGAQTLAATGANVGTGSLIRSLEGEEGAPNLEQFTMDALWGVIHGVGYRASEKAKALARGELASRGWAQHEIDNPSAMPERFRAGEEQPALTALRAPEKAQGFSPEFVGEGEMPPRPGGLPKSEIETRLAEIEAELGPREEIDPKTQRPRPARILTVEEDRLLADLQNPESERRLGPGAANVEEAAPQRQIGIYNAAVDAQRAERGLPPLMSEARQADTATWDKTEQRIEADPEFPARLVEDINSGKKTSVSDVEQTSLLWRIIDLRNRRENELNRWNDENASPEDRAQAKVYYEAFEEQLQRTEEADRKSGTMQGRALRIRRMLVNEDHTFAGMMGRAKIAKGDALTPAETAKIKAESEAFQKADKALEQRERQLEEDTPVDAAIKAIEAEARKDPTFTPEVRSLAERISARLEKAASSALNRLRAKGFLQLGSAPDPTIIADLVIYGTAKLTKGLLDFSRWSASMVRDLGRGVEPHLREVWDASNVRIDEAASAGGKNKSKVKEAVTKAPAVATADGIGAKMKERSAAGEKLTGMRGDIQKLVETFVRGGIKTRGPLLDAVHDVLKTVDPAITRREASDAISGYGDFKQISKDEISTTVRDLRQQLQQTSKIEDLQAGKPLQKTGVERQPPSDEGRALIKQVNELARKLGVTVTDPATQLKTVLGAIKTRLTNRITDLRAEITAGERAVKTKTTPPSSEQIEALRKELALVEAEHEAAFGKRQMTDEQRLKNAISSAKRAEQSEETRLEKAKRGVFERPLTKPAQKSAELDAIKARTEAAREERKALENAASPPLSDAQKRLDAALVAKERWDQVLAGEIAPAKKLPREALSELEADARAEIAAMRELAAEIRRDSKPKTDPEIAKENTAIKALEKAAAEYERRLNEADFSPKGKKQGADTAKVAQARALRDAAKAAYDAALKATKPVRTKEQIALQNYKAMAARKIAELQDRMARGDFAPPPKRPKLDISKDPEAVKAKAEKERVVRDFQKQQQAWKLKQRSFFRKGIDFVKDVLGSSRTLITSADLSAPFRQGGVFAIGDLVFNPLRLGRQLGGMLRSATSEVGFQRQQAAIRLRPNADLYERSGLYLADIDGTFTGREENMRSNLAEQIPIAGRVVRGSNRAYAGFLNRQRADAFDAFVQALGGKDKVSPQDAQFVAKGINDLTGRGEASKGWTGSMDAMARFFFSPRFLISRFKTLLGAPVLRGQWRGKDAVSLRARAKMAAPYLKFAGALSVLYGLAQLNGADVEKDVRSSDFGKIRIGDTRLDPLAGLAQVSTFLGRTITGENADGSDKNRMETFLKFGRTKLSPIAGIVADRMMEKRLDLSEPTPYRDAPLTALGEDARRLTTPISYAELPDIYEEHGATKAALLQMLGLLGFGLQNY